MLAAGLLRGRPAGPCGGASALVADLPVEEVAPLLNLVLVLATRLLVDEVARRVQRTVGLLLVLEGLRRLVLQLVESDHGVLLSVSARSGTRGLVSRTQAVSARGTRQVVCSADPQVRPAQVADLLP